jgi:hypothetical protein
MSKVGKEHFSSDIGNAQSASGLKIDGLKDRHPLAIIFGPLSDNSLSATKIFLPAKETKKCV